MSESRIKVSRTRTIASDAGTVTDTVAVEFPTSWDARGEDAIGLLDLVHSHLNGTPTPKVRRSSDRTRKQTLREAFEQIVSTGKPDGSPT